MKLTKAKWKKIWKEFYKRFDDRDKNAFSPGPSWGLQKKQIEQIISEQFKQ